MFDTVLLCSLCNKRLIRKPSAINSNGHNFCNHHCSAIFTNTHRITNATINRKLKRENSRICARLGCHNHIGLENKKYCSKVCQCFVIKIVREKFKAKIIRNIKRFASQHNRLPFKREFVNEYTRVVLYFGSWNNMIKLAGFEPNPVRFSKHYIANDGHKCDSLSEKIVDDWFFARKISHQVKVKYPWDNGMTADFKIGEYWIELFGLTGQLKSYDRLMRIKLKKIKEHNLNLISLFLGDLFPKNHLEDKLSILQKNTRYL